MRVATYNVRSLKQDRDAVVAVLRSLDADVVALQEPPKWWRGGARLRRLAADCGLVVVVAGGLRGGRTCALLARPALAATATDARAVRLRLRLTGRRHWFPTLRGAALAVVEVEAGATGGSAAVVVCVHLSLDPRERAEHLDVLTREISRTVARSGIAARGAGGPAGAWGSVVVAGDLNEPPGGRAWLTLEGRGLRDTGAADARPTFSAANPRRRLDVVLAGALVAGNARRVDHPLAARASDHLPVVGDLRAPPDRGAG